MPMSYDEVIEFRAASLAHQAQQEVEARDRKKMVLRRITLFGLTFCSITVSAYVFTAEYWNELLKFPAS